MYRKAAAGGQEEKFGDEGGVGEGGPGQRCLPGAIHASGPGWHRRRHVPAGGCTRFKRIFGWIICKPGEAQVRRKWGGDITRGPDDTTLPLALYSPVCNRLSHAAVTTPFLPVSFPPGADARSPPLPPPP